MNNLITYAYLVGVSGLLFIIGGWFISVRTIPPVTLSGLYSLGSLLLAVYSYIIGDPVFIALNIIAFSISGFQFFRGLKKERSKK